ncbi:hypothetical protein HYDPIDRAFT_170915 [Hydnomerulius pinastri MD-312]|uniref:Uncharacterized protein n=1 Tax=Hydnomerulius pinastri MD-312 TaxID=994086 RepID=A0A0C9W0A5_9AGAM|nr:hypothetical protein HYDPIDRAFT_170915 [Hydnomerulius pinastri MD-312]
MTTWESADDMDPDAEEMNKPALVDDLVYSKLSEHHITISKNPHKLQQPISEIIEPITVPLSLSILHPLGRTAVREVDLPFSALDVYHGFKFSLATLGNDADGDVMEKDWVRAVPAISRQPARFDMVIVMTDVNCELTGLEGTCLGCLWVIFTLPEVIYAAHAAPAAWPKKPLAYVEWHSKWQPTAEEHHNMYLVTKQQSNADGSGVSGQIVPLTIIQQSLMTSQEHGIVIMY